MIPSKGAKHQKTPLEITYEQYVHFAYKVAVYTKQKSVKRPSFKPSELIHWYCKEYPKYICKPTSFEYSKKVYRTAINCLIEDEVLQKVATEEPADSFEVKTDERFLTWAWRGKADSYEADVNRHWTGSDVTSSTHKEGALAGSSSSSSTKRSHPATTGSSTANGKGKKMAVGIAERTSVTHRQRVSEQNTSSKNPQSSSDAKAAGGVVRGDRHVTVRRDANRSGFLGTLSHRTGGF